MNFDNNEKDKNSVNTCESCILHEWGQCEKRSAEKNVIKKCQSLASYERFNFAKQHRFLDDLDSIFASLFWDLLHDPKDIWIILKSIKYSFDNTNTILPELYKENVKKQLFIELIVKFCKLAEDLGALLLSKNNNIIKFTQKYNTYGTYEVTNFYNNLQINNNSLRNLFFYPLERKQNVEQAKKYLKVSLIFLNKCFKQIKNDYLQYRKIYNSYKHGYRIWFKDAKVEIQGQTTYNNALLYLDSKLVKSNFGTISSIFYSNFKISKIFKVCYYSCLSIILLIYIYIFNYRKYLSNSLEDGILLFFDAEFLLKVDPPSDNNFIQKIKDMKRYRFKYKLPFDNR